MTTINFTNSTGYTESFTQIELNQLLLQMNADDSKYIRKVSGVAFVRITNTKMLLVDGTNRINRLLLELFNFMYDLTQPFYLKLVHNNSALEYDINGALISVGYSGAVPITSLSSVYMQMYETGNNGYLIENDVVKDVGEFALRRAELKAFTAGTGIKLENDNDTFTISTDLKNYTGTDVIKVLDEDEQKLYNLKTSKSIKVEKTGNTISFTTIKSVDNQELDEPTQPTTPSTGASVPTPPVPLPIDPFSLAGLLGLLGLGGGSSSGNDRTISSVFFADNKYSVDGSKLIITPKKKTNLFFNDSFFFGKNAGYTKKQIDDLLNSKQNTLPSTGAITIPQVTGLQDALTNLSLVQYHDPNAVYLFDESYNDTFFYLQDSDTIDVVKVGNSIRFNIKRTDGQSTTGLPIFSGGSTGLSIIPSIPIPGGVPVVVGGSTYVINNVQFGSGFTYSVNGDTVTITSKGKNSKPQFIQENVYFSGKRNVYTKTETDTLLSYKAPAVNPKFLGNVGINTITPDSALHIVGERNAGPNSVGIRMGSTSSAFTGASDSYGIEICSDTSDIGGSTIDFTYPYTNTHYYAGRMVYQNREGYFGWNTRVSPATSELLDTSFDMKLDSAGNLIVQNTISTPALWLNGENLQDKLDAKANQTNIYTKTDVYSKSEVDTKFSSLVGGASSALDTLKELGDALNNDGSFATNITNLINTKANKSNPKLVGKVIIGIDDSTDADSALQISGARSVASASNGIRMGSTSGIFLAGGESYGIEICSDSTAGSTIDFSSNIGFYPCYQGRMFFDNSVGAFGWNTNKNNVTTEDINPFADMRLDKDGNLTVLGTITTSNIMLNGIDLATRISNLTTELGLYTQSQVNNLLNLRAPASGPSFTGSVSFTNATSITGLTKSMIGLSQVDDTSDVNKPISIPTQTALNAKANILNPKFDGYLGIGLDTATADSALHLVGVRSTAPNSVGIRMGSASTAFTSASNSYGIEICSDAYNVGGSTIDFTYPYSTAGYYAGRMLFENYNGYFGWNTRYDLATSELLDSSFDMKLDKDGNLYVLASVNVPVIKLNNVDLASTLSSKANSAGPSFTGVVSFTGASSVTGLTKSMIGLSNVENTSDANKPISNATQTALDAKSNILNPKFSGSVGIGLGTSSADSALHIVGARNTSPNTVGIRMGSAGTVFASATDSYGIEICSDTVGSGGSTIDFTYPNGTNATPYYAGRMLFENYNGYFGWNANFTPASSEFLDQSFDMKLDNVGNLTVQGSVITPAITLNGTSLATTLSSKANLASPAFSGNVGVLTTATTPNSAFHVQGSISATCPDEGIHMGFSTTNVNDTMINLVSPSATGSSFISFGSKGTPFAGRIMYLLNGNSMRFYIAQAVMMLLTGSGLCINTTVNNATLTVSGTASISSQATVGSLISNGTSKLTGNVGIGVAADTGTPSATVFQLRLSTEFAYKPTTNTWYTSSDERLKEDIEDADLDLCYNNIKNIPLKYYKWKDDFINETNTEDQHKLGWIAQNVETVFPKAVNKSDMYGIEDCRSINTDQLYATMYGTIQKLQQIVEAQDLRIKQLEKILLSK